MTGAGLGHAGATRAQKSSLGTPAAQAPDRLGLVQSGFGTEMQLVCEFRASHHLSAAPRWGRAPRPHFLRRGLGE